MAMMVVAAVTCVVVVVVVVSWDLTVLLLLLLLLHLTAKVTGANRESRCLQTHIEATFTPMKTLGEKLPTPPSAVASFGMANDQP